MTPNYERAAIAAAETLIKYDVKSAPVAPLPILKKIPGVLVVTYEEMSKEMGMKRDCVISMFGQENQDAFTSVNVVDGKPQYLVTYNQRLSVTLFHRALAREMSHILLGHDESTPKEVRDEEAKCFAHHLLCPRALIHSIMATGHRLTTEVMGNLTGCYDYCLACMRRLPGVNVPAELNKKIRDNFMDYILNFFEYQRFARYSDGSALADLGSYMDGYTE